MSLSRCPPNRQQARWSFRSAWTLLVKPPRDRPKACTQAPFPPTAETWPRTGGCRSCAASRRSVPDRRALQQRIPDALFGPASKPHIDGVPLTVTFVHVPPGVTYPQHMKHAVEKTPVNASRPGPAPPLRWKKRADQLPLGVRQVPTTYDCSPKSSLEAKHGRL